MQVIKMNLRPVEPPGKVSPRDGYPGRHVPPAALSKRRIHRLEKLEDGMKCPRCWTEKAYRHPQQGWKAKAWAALSLVSMKCRHCYHKFYVPWLATLGKTTEPPLRSAGTHRASTDTDRTVPARRRRIAA